MFRECNYELTDDAGMAWKTLLPGLVETCWKNRALLACVKAVGLVRFVYESVSAESGETFSLNHFHSFLSSTVRLSYVIKMSSPYPIELKKSPKP